MKRILNAFKFSFQGLSAAMKEPAFCQEAVALLISIPLLIFVPVELFYKLLIFSLHCTLMSVELLNTAVEKIADLVSPDFHPLVKLAKDMGSAAVFMIIVAGFTVWGFAIYAAWPVWFPG